MLRNLSKSAMTVSLETAVLTDDYELHDGVYYRSLTPRLAPSSTGTAAR